MVGNASNLLVAGKSIAQTFHSNGAPWTGGADLSSAQKNGFSPF